SPVPTYCSAPHTSIRVRRHVRVAGATAANMAVGLLACNRVGNDFVGPRYPAAQAACSGGLRLARVRRLFQGGDQTPSTRLALPAEPRLASAKAKQKAHPDVKGNENQQACDGCRKICAGPLGKHNEQSRHGPKNSN